MLLPLTACVGCRAVGLLSWTDGALEELVVDDDAAADGGSAPCTNDGVRGVSSLLRMSAYALERAGDIRAPPCLLGSLWSE